MDVVSHQLTLHGCQVHYLEKLPATASSRTSLATVLFLHGASFCAQTWNELGSLTLMMEKGYRAIAVDLPGYGQSQSGRVDPLAWMRSLVSALQIQQPVLISPSMSGNYSLPFVCAAPDQIRGYVAVSPVSISRFLASLHGNPVPTLAIWGSNDRVVPVSQAQALVKVMSQAELVLLPNAGHACYMREPEAFHQSVLAFCDRCFSA